MSKYNRQFEQGWKRQKILKLQSVKFKEIPRSHTLTVVIDALTDPIHFLIHSKRKRKGKTFYLLRVTHLQCTSIGCTLPCGPHH